MAARETRAIAYLRRRGRLVTIYEIKEDDVVVRYGWHAVGETKNNCRDAQEATRKAYEQVDKAMDDG